MSIDSLLSFQSWTDLKVNSIEVKNAVSDTIYPALFINTNTVVSPTADAFMQASAIVFCGGGGVNLSSLTIPSGASISAYIGQDVNDYYTFTKKLVIYTTGGTRSILTPTDIYQVFPTSVTSTWLNDPAAIFILPQQGTIDLVFTWYPSLSKWACFGLFG